MTDSSAVAQLAWLISDGAAGNMRQCAALARAMGLADTETRLVGLRQPWRALAPRLTVGAQRAFVPPVQPPWPALAIGCGRQAALLTRLLRGWSGGATFTVQILDPRIDAATFDVVVAPRHDGVAGGNVIAPLGALNPVDDEWLRQAKVDFSTLQQLPQPRSALLVGGPRRGLGLDAAWLETFVAHIEAMLQRAGGSLMVALSRRTPPQWRERLRGAFGNGCVHFWAGVQDGINPYPGYLAWAERIIVTPDSVNMLSEACATGVPVLSLLPAAAGGRIAAFHAALRAEGRLQSLDNVDISTLPQIAPLRETAAVAAQIRQRYSERGAVAPAPP